MSHDQQERWRRYHEAIERASQQGSITPEQVQMIQAAFLQMQQPGAGEQVYTVIQNPDGSVVQQSSQPAGHPAGYPGAKAPPTTRMPGQQPRPAGMPQGHVDSLYRNALAELQRWEAQYGKYRGQGGFAQLESIFQTIKQITGR